MKLPTHQNKESVRIGLVGAGGIGRIHLAAYAQIARAQIVAICDSNLPAAQAAALETDDTVKCFETIEAMFADESLALDAVDICLPPSSHCQIALAAFERGLHVLCEKPLAHSPEAGRVMLDAARTSGLLLLPGFCHRFHPPIMQVKALIASGELGEVRMFRNRFGAKMAGMSERWFANKSIAGGGALLDTGIHSIDLFRHLVGEVATVQATLQTVDPAFTQVEDTAHMLLSTADGRSGTIEASWSLATGLNVVEIYGTEGAAYVHYGDGQTSRYRTGSMEDWLPLDESGPDRFTGELSHFVDACLGLAALKMDGYDGLRAVEIAFDAYRTAEIYLYDPDTWTTGDEEMTGAQKSYLKTLSDQAGEEFDDTLTKANASKKIDELQQKTWRGAE